ncbi:MAG: hypothetical protein HZB39_20270 [Planctomycetes bacterium]|nr:hypothetical protein [Planctomycetota bacterium]
MQLGIDSTCATGSRPRPAGFPASPALCAAVLALAVPAARAQDPARPDQDPLSTLRAENRALRVDFEAMAERVRANEARLDGLSRGFEGVAVDESRWTDQRGRSGLGPAASKVYGGEPGLSIGGYGEILFESREGATDRFDALRAVTFIGYRFDETLVFDSEIEIEHGTTSASSGTTSSGGSVSLEFGYLDWLATDAFGVRAGLLLVPLGLVNEMHEPGTFLAAQRSQTEQRIIPTTWRAPGFGLHGEVGGFTWRSYALASLDGEEFNSSGLRGGRQQGNREAADDLALAARVDWIDTPGLLVGVSGWHGDTGQDGIGNAGVAIPALATTVIDVHADWKSGPYWFRGLWAEAFVDDALAFDVATGRALAERMRGVELEAGFDVFAVLAPERGQSLWAFARHEWIDTQVSLPPGIARDPAQDDRFWTFGLHWRPLDGISVKADYTIAEEGRNGANLLLGYSF